MLDTVMTLLHGAVLLAFGVCLSAAFAGVRPSRRNVLAGVGIFVLCGVLQIAVYMLGTEEAVWKLYPLVTHIPIVLCLMLLYHRHLAAALASVATAYLCCQPAKWFGVLTFSMTQNVMAEYCVRICALIAVGVAAACLFTPTLSEIFSGDPKRAVMFGIVPVVYYMFDYAMGIYTAYWVENNRAAVEFLPFLLCVVFLMFCMVYYREYKRRADAEREEQIVRIAVRQQEKEVEELRRSEHEMRILRHDMRLFLNNLALCMESKGVDAARKMIAGYVANVDGTAVQRYCSNAMVNYILSDYAARCADAQVRFLHTVRLDELAVDEIMFSSILSNALDNALNAQRTLPEKERRIEVMLRTQNGRLLFSVRNPFGRKPVFVDGMPVSERAGHGYGTRSICYMTERLGGECQFTTEGNTFILRVMI